MPKRFFFLLFAAVAAWCGAALCAKPAELEFNKVKYSPGAVPLLKNGNYVNIIDLAPEI